MMKAHLTLTFALLLVCTGAAFAQGTPDLLTPAQEDVCDSETGAAYGLCNAYCEAMDCDSANAQASPTACTKVKDKFTNITGRSLPCEGCPAPPPGTTCPCADAFADFNTVLNSSSGGCVDAGLFVGKLTEIGAAVATCAPEPEAFCGVETGSGPQILPTTSAEGSACVHLILDSCNP